MIDNMDPRALRSHRALMDTAIDVLLQNPMASLSEIAQAAKVGRATFYRHFESREALIKELALESHQQVDDVLEPIRALKLDARDTLSLGLKAVMQVANRFHFLLLLWHISESDSDVENIYQRQLSQLSNLIEQGKKEKSIQKDISTTWIVNLIDSLVYAGWWSVYSGDLSAEEAGEHAVRVLFNGVSN